MRSIIAIIAVLLVAPVLAQPTVSREQVGEHEWVVLDNGLVRVAVNPAEHARIEAFRHLPTGVDLMKRHLVTEKREPLLPVRRLEELGGAEDHFWGAVVQWKVTDTRLLRAEVVEGAAVVETEGDHNGVTVRRRLTLRPDTVVVDVHTTLTNAADKPVTHSYWFHTTPEISRRDWAQPADWRVPDEPELTVAPVTDKPGRLGREQPLVPGPGTVVVDTSSYNTFFAPAQPWFAKWDRALGFSFVVDFRMQDMLPDGALFATRVRGAWPGRNSLEVVTGTRSLKPGETQEVPLRFMALPDSGTPLAVSPSWALSLAGDGYRLHALRGMAAGTAEVVAADGTVTATCAIPALSAGKWHDLKVPAELAPTEVRVNTQDTVETLPLCMPVK